MMNLALIKEINTLHKESLSYTQIADTTGIAKSTIVLSLRLSKIFETAHTEQTQSYQQEIKHLNTSVTSLTQSIDTKESELKKLNALIDIDYNKNILIQKREYHDLKNDLEEITTEADILQRQLVEERNIFNNLSFSDKLNLLFQ